MSHAVHSRIMTACNWGDIKWIVSIKIHSFAEVLFTLFDLLLEINLC